MRAERRGRVILACSMANRDLVGGAGERAEAERKAVWPDDKSPVSREAHAGICESRGVRLPPATRPARTGCGVRGDIECSGMSPGGAVGLSVGVCRYLSLSMRSSFPPQTAGGCFQTTVFRPESR